MALPSALEVRPPKGWGKIHGWRRLVQGVLSVLFLVAPFIDLCRFDLQRGRLILLRTPFSLLELGPIYLLFLISLLTVFAGAYLYGRLYCGWICPQTTLSELAATFERWIIRRRKAPAWRVALAKLAVVVLSSVVAASLVSYFLDPADYARPPQAAWIAWGVLALIIAGDLLWLRHRFCVGVCPYGILQSIIQDNRTLGVSLDHDLTKVCLKCMSCVRSCFMGIDIRRADFHPNCINCGDCLDAINRSHRRLDRPIVTGFRYGSAPASNWPRILRALGVSDWRRAFILAGLLALVGALVTMLASRSGVEGRLTPLYERVRVDASDRIHNHYRLALTNHLDRRVTLRVTARGLGGIAVVSPATPVTLRAGDRSTFVLVLRAPRRATRKTSWAPIVVLCEGDNVKVELRSMFFFPKPKPKPR